MGAGLRVYKDNGSLLFDTEKIVYGLMKSGYMSLQETWPRLRLKSAQLDPNNPSNWEETSPVDALHGFSVTGVVSPIVFIVGPGNTAGASRVGNTTTFYYMGASTSTKFYYFDTMQNIFNGAGLKCFDTAGNLTFNSLQYPLNIVDTVTAPALGSPIAPGSPWLHTAYAGGVDTMSSYIEGPTSSVTVPLSGGECAAAITFTRGGTVWGGGVYPFMAACSEGAYGGNNSVIFRFRLASRTTEQTETATNAPIWTNIPSDRFPQALVIRTSNLPFPPRRHGGPCHPPLSTAGRHCRGTSIAGTRRWWPRNC